MGKSDGPRLFQVTLDGTTTSKNIYLDPSKVTSIQLIANKDATGTLDASVTVTSSNHVHGDRDENVLHHGAAPVWSTESSIVFTAITTGAQDEMLHVGNLGCKWLKIALARNSGTGRVDVWINGRD